jgi:hypothetical protein
MNRNLVTYHYYESPEYQENLLYFIEFGIIAENDYIIVVSGGCLTPLPIRENVRLLFVRNDRYDYGGYCIAVNSIIKKETSKYKYFCFLNCSVRGPFTPGYFDDNWTDIFTKYITTDVKLVGATICMLQRGHEIYGQLRHTRGRDVISHVQSMFYAMDASTMKHLIDLGFYGREFPASKASTIIHYEIALSDEIMKLGGNITSVVPEYNGIDYRLADSDINPSSSHGDPSVHNGYFGRTFSPLDEVFVKTNRGLYTDEYLGSLASSSRSRIKRNSVLIPQSKIPKIEAHLANITTAWRGHQNFSIWVSEWMHAETVVDLGVDFGFSTICFSVGCNGRVFGIDSFEGDEHAGFRDTKPEVEKAIEDLGIQNVTLIKGYFASVAKDWVKSIDILHIDGLHTYEAIHDDFAIWSKFVREGGLILLHDTCVEHFGVRKLFDEIDLPKLNFKNSHGLGVISADKNLIREISIRFENLVEENSVSI